MKKTAMITGSNRGIGKALVTQFAREGYDIWACARKQTKEFEAEIKAIAEECKVEIVPVYFDLQNYEDMKAAIKVICSFKRNIDVLINNAGVAYGASFLMTPIEKMMEVYEINVFAQVKLMQLISKQMIRQKSGCIINMCSVGGIEHTPGYLAYGSSKAALIWITKAASKELSQYGIRVNGIAPGLIDTDMGKYKSTEEIEKVIDRTSIKRMGNALEIAKAAVFIADVAEFMTGHVMVIDGGRI